MGRSCKAMEQENGKRVEGGMYPTSLAPRPRWVIGLLSLASAVVSRSRARVYIRAEG